MTYKLNFEGNQIESHLVGLPMVLQMFSGIIVYDYATCNVMSIGMDASRNITVSNLLALMKEHIGHLLLINSKFLDVMLVFEQV